MWYFCSGNLTLINNSFDINFWRFTSPPTWHHTFFWSKTPLHSKWLIDYLCDFQLLTMNLLFCNPRLWKQCLSLFPRQSQAWVLGEWTSNRQDLPYDWVSQEMSEWSLYILMSQSNTDHHFETNFESSCIFMMQRTKNVHPFLYCWKEKLRDGYKKLCKKHGISSYNFSEAALGYDWFFRQVIELQILQSYLFWRRPYQSHSYCGRKVSNWVYWPFLNLFKIWSYFLNFSSLSKTIGQKWFFSYIFILIGVSLSNVESTCGTIISLCC